MNKNILAILLTMVLFLAACEETGEGTESVQESIRETAIQVTDADTESTLEATAIPAETTEASTEMPASEPTETVSAAEEKGGLPADLTVQLDTFLQSQVYSDGGNPNGAAPGLVLLVDTHDGRYLNAAGVSSLEEGTPMQVDDRLEIGSNSKSFTIAVLMQLQEEGLLSFDDRLGDWLPELAEQIPNGDQITLRQLAAHTSGIWDYGDPLIGAAAENPDLLEVGYAPQELVQYAIENGAPEFDPGTNFKYSNTGYILLGMIAEKASGQSLGELYQERIFDPLGLETAVFIEGVPQEGDITTQGYWWLNDGTRLDTTNWNVSLGWAAGGIAMTAEELAAYAKALAAGELFQDPDTLAQMLSFNEQSLAFGGAPFGLGLMDFGNGYWGHEGQTAGFQSLWFTNPEEGITVVGLTNSAAYSAYGFLNVINILNGSGAQPFQSATLLPIAAETPAFATSNWQWVQAVEGSNVTDIPPGFILSLAGDGTASVSGPTCEPISGSFTADVQAQISFEFDLSAVSCVEDDPTLQLVNALQMGGSWRFENGGLVITLARDDAALSAELIFLPPPPATGIDTTAEACPLFDLPFPRPEPDYAGKLARDLTPFANALTAYTVEDAAAHEDLVSGKTVLELQALMKSGELSAEDLVVYYVERIQRYDIDGLNSVLEINPDALAIAQALDEERASGTVRGDMHGIPVLLKDNIATGDGMHSAAGAAALLDWDPDRDAFLVSQLREAGAVILGKANLSEWANYMDSCMPNGFSTNGGQTQNPYGPFETYGSSSGSAVAVAADLTAVSVGTETQGSIIQPAGINSVVALKPTKGLISTDYVIPLLPFQDVPGPMGRTVTDVAVLLSAMTGTDENDFTTAATAELAGVDFTRYLNPESAAEVRVGLPVWNEEALQAFFSQNEITDEEQQAQLREVFAGDAEEVNAMRERLESAGLTVVEIPNSEMMLLSPTDIRSLLEYGFKQAINDFLAGLGEDAPVSSLEEIIAFNNEDLANRAPYGQDYLEGSQNTAITQAEFASLQQQENGRARNALDIIFENHDIDVLISDGTQLYAPAGYPALSVPAGYAVDGTPQATVFIGRWLSEPQLLAAGYAYEQATQARVAPDLEAAMALIAELPGPAAGEAAGDMAVDEAVEDIPEQADLANTLGNLSYDGLFPEEAITLVDGYAAYEDGSSATPYVQLMSQLIPTGDLDGDGTEDAVAFLEDNSSGSGRFAYLVAVLDVLGDAVPTEGLMVGDRIQIKSLSLVGKQIVADLIAQGPGDALCCASWNVRKIFTLNDGVLVEQSSEEISQVSLDDINNTSWRLLDLNFGQEPALPDVDVTLHLQDGVVNGSAGCNNYRSSITSGSQELNTVVIGPAAVNNKACPEPVMAQETAFLTKLAGTTSWWFDTGRLMLSYPMEDGLPGELVFEQIENTTN
ncbi:MAG: amidase family protein [Candidatus Promineifilaceae bacterium]